MKNKKRVFKWDQKRAWWFDTVTGEPIQKHTTEEQHPVSPPKTDCVGKNFDFGSDELTCTNPDCQDKGACARSTKLSRQS